MLQFSPPNAKLQGLTSIVAYVEQRIRQGDVYAFDLPAGWTCPGAHLCKSKAVKTNDGWRIQDGRQCAFRCYAASQEVLLPNVRRLRQRNLKELRSLKTSARMAEAIIDSIPFTASVVRIHSSGDFYCQAYLDAWLHVAEVRSDIIFYAYTKAIPFWNKRRAKIAKLPNFRLTASLGGKYDHLIKRDYRTCRIVLSYEEAEELGLGIDHDDSYAVGIRPDQHYAVLIHGTQPEGSEAGKAMYQLRKAGLNGYRRRPRKRGLSELLA